jgi:hypothetical protein
LLNAKGEFLNGEEGQNILKIAESDNMSFAEVDDLGKITKATVEDDFFLNTLTLDATLRMGYDDFGIYAKNERQVERLKKLQNLCDALNDLEIRLDWLILQRATSQSISFTSGKWEPNVLTLSNF